MGFVAPSLTLRRKDASQLERVLWMILKGLRDIVRTSKECRLICRGRCSISRRSAHCRVPLTVEMDGVPLSME